MQNYKIGDYVRVLPRKPYQKFQFPGFGDFMANYCGNIGKIKKIVYDNMVELDFMDGKNYPYTWHTDWLYPISPTSNLLKMDYKRPLGVLDEEFWETKECSITSISIKDVCWNVVPEVKKIIKNKRTTIVFWQDGTKTMVRRAEGTEDDEYFAFASALAKKVYRNNSRIHKLLKEKTVWQAQKKLTKTK